MCSGLLKIGIEQKLNNISFDVCSRGKLFNTGVRKVVDQEYKRPCFYMRAEKANGKKGAFARASRIA